MQNRRGSRPIRSTTRSLRKPDDQTDELTNDSTNDPPNIETQRQFAPYHDQPTLKNSVVCLLTATHYVVSCSVGLDGRTMLPFNAVFDTGSGMNIVRQDALTDGWETFLTKDAMLPTLGALVDIFLTFGPRVGLSVQKFAMGRRVDRPWTSRHKTARDYYRGCMRIECTRTRSHAYGT